MAIGLGIGIGITIAGAGQAGEAIPRIQLSGLSIAEDASVDDVIGTLSVSNSEDSWTFSITADPDSKFKIANDDELQLDATLDYETATSHQVTIEADNGVDDPISRTFTISVTNVIEAPVFASAPVVTGALDGILTCSTGVLEQPDGAGATFAFQWKDADDDSDLTGETSNTLDTQDYIGLEVYCTVTATNSADSTPADSNTVGPLASGVSTPVMIVLEGDSIMQAFPDFSGELGPHVTLVNAAIGGTRMADWMAEINDTIALFDEFEGEKWLCIMEGNSLYDDALETCIANLDTYCDIIRGHGVKVMAFATLARGGGGPFNEQRAEVRAHWIANVGVTIDAFADFADLPEGMFDDDAPDNPLWYQEDKIHLLTPPSPVYTECVAIVVDEFETALAADAAAPTVAVLTPPDNSTTVVATDPLTLRFNEIVRFTDDVTIELRLAADNSVVEAWDETDIGTGIELGFDGESAGPVLTITPSSPLAAGTEHYVHIASGSFEDLAGNAYGGMTGTTWSFTTVAALGAAIKAKLESWWPLDEASGTREDAHGSNDLTDNNTVGSSTINGVACAEFVKANAETLSIADNASLSFSDPMFVGGWAVATTASNGDRIATKIGGFGVNEWAFELLFEGEGFVLRFRPGDGGNDQAGAKASYPGNTNPFFWVGAIDGTNVKLSVNGAAFVTVTPTYSEGGPVDTAASFVLGTTLNGKMNRTFFGKGEISIEEVAWLYNSGDGRDYGDL